MSRMRWSIAAGILALAGAWAAAEVTVSITVNGELNEVLPLLQFLQAQGEGGMGGAASQGLQVQVHSVTAAPGDAAPAAGSAAPQGAVMLQPGQPVPIPPPPPPTLGIVAAAVEPAQAKAGAVVTVTARVSDPKHEIDTLGASAPTLGNLSFDLYDNGSNGDTTPGDGTWSFRAMVPAGSAPGPYTITITAYSAKGVPLTAPGPDGKPQPVSAKAVLTVVQ